MKNIFKKYKLYHLLFVALFIATACDNDLDINKDPDALTPDLLTMSTELPASTLGIVGATGAPLAIVGGFWSQFWTQSAVANQYKTIDNYGLKSNASIISSGWSSMYDALLDTRNIKANALASKNWNFYLISTTLEAYAFQVLVDFFGDVPFTEALNPAILNPKFDSAESIYDALVINLKDALAKDLSTSSILEVPSESNDVLFEGNMDKWTEFANTLLLKIYLRQTEKRPSVAEDGIKALLMNANTKFLTSSAAITKFIDSDSRSNPLYESNIRQLNVGSNLRASATMGNYLKDNSDPRLAKFYDGTTFQVQGDFENPANTGSESIVISKATDPFNFISLAESKFLQAEAKVRYMSGTGAKALYEEGVTASFTQWELQGDAALTTLLGSSGAYEYLDSDTKEAKIELIITQKWISCFPGSGQESFFEYNRTGYPAGIFTYSVEGITESKKFPRRLIYPLSEFQRNSNAPAQNTNIVDNAWYQNN